MASIYDEIECLECKEKKIRFFFNAERKVCKACVALKHKDYIKKVKGNSVPRFGRHGFERAKRRSPASDWANVQKSD